MNPEHEERLQAIKERANAATGGPWEIVPWQNGRPDLCGDGLGIAFDITGVGNQQFITHSRDDIPWLIERLREAEADGRQRRRCLQALPVYGKVKGNATTDYEGPGDADAPIPHCKISELHPGDTIVFKFPGVLSEGAAAHLRKSLAAIFGGDHRVVLLENGGDLEIVRPECEAESAAEQEPAHMAELRRDAKTNRTAAMLLAQ